MKMAELLPQKMYPFTISDPLCVYFCHYLTPMKDYKYLSWVYGVDRKICHEGH